jgi:hypothetical protein
MEQGPMNQYVLLALVLATFLLAMLVIWRNP